MVKNFTKITSALIKKYQTRVEVSNSEEHSNLIIYSFKYWVKKFDSTKLFQPALIFGIKARAYPSKAPFRLSIVG